MKLRPLRMQAAYEKGARGAFHFSVGDIAGIVAAVPEKLKARTIEEAEAAAEGRFDFRGLGERVFRGRVDWTAAGMHRSWRWDLNRHAFFVALGKAHYYTGEMRFLRKLAETWEDWIRTNPAGRGENWEQPFEVAARLQNWMWAYSLLAESGWAGEERLAWLREAMREHAEFVAAHLEYHWPNNHLLLEAKALAEWAVLFPGMDRRGKWLKRGLRMVEEQVAVQVLADGVHCELCPMYHRIVAGEMAEFVELCRRNGVALRRETGERIAKMTAFSAAMLREDGTTPLFGDSAIQDEYLRFDVSRREHSDMNWWLWRGGSPQVGKNRAGSGEVTLDVFEDAGYAVMRDGERGVHLAFDAGPFSRCAAADHAHCDALSFELCAGGRPLIVDPGVYFPAGDGAAWRNHLRSTAAHNTVMIDEREQSELWGLSDVKRTARVQMTEQGCAKGAAFLVGECEPYWGGGEGIVHRRELQYTDGRVEIFDRVEGSGSHWVAWHFHFAPGVRVKLNGNGEIVGRDESGEELFRMRARTGRADWKLVEGKEGEVGMGWVSRNSVKLERAWAAVIEREVELPVEEEFEIEVLRKVDREHAEAHEEESSVRWMLRESLENAKKKMKRPPSSRTAGLRRASRERREGAVNTEKRKIAYVAMEAPARVEWYVGEEVQALRERDVEVVMYGVKRPRWEELNEVEKKLARETTHFRPWRRAKLARAAWMCFSNWQELRPIYKRVVFGGRESLRRRVKGMVHTWMGVYFALLLKGRGVQHVHAHHGYFAAWAAMVAARLLGITYSVTLHGSDMLVDRVFLDEKVKRAEAVFTVSEYNRRVLLERCPEMEAERVVVRKMGVRTMDPDAEEAEERGHTGRLEVLAVGRLVAVKDIGFLVRACAMLKARGVKVRCRIVGEGPERGRLERQIQEMELEREVELAGSVARDQVQRLYDEADIVALTSKSEGIPLVLMEAMARGAIVLAPEITGIPELVRDGETGFLYRAGDLDDFLARVEWIRRRLPELSDVRRQARKFVWEHFDAEKNTAAFCRELLRRLGWSAVEEATAHDENPVLQQV